MDINLTFETSTTSFGSSPQAILVLWRNKMSPFWKKMKASFLQVKICEVSQIRINKNPLCVVVDNIC